MGIFLRAVLIAAGLVLSGCTLEAKLGEIVKMEATFMNGAVTANQKAMTVQSGYFVQSSAGSLTDGEIEVTPQGYKVFLSTQAIIVSE